MKVLKFGGSSVYNSERIRGVISILKKYNEQKEPFTVVFSAFGGVTDLLIAMAKNAAKGDFGYLSQLDLFKERHYEVINSCSDTTLKSTIENSFLKNLEELRNILQGVFLVKEASSRTMDYIVSFGERNAAFIISCLMQEEGMKTTYLDARTLVVTDKNFGSAKVDFEATFSKTKNHYSLHNQSIGVVTGFIGATPEGITTTLGRGGSDYTAAIFGAALDASAIEIWTDVDGVLTADPRKVKKAFTIPQMSYSEAMEMSHFGAKVIYPPTIQPALERNIPLYIKNTFNPSFSGTYISNEPFQHSRMVQGISSINNISLLTLQGSGLFGVPGISGRLFSTLAQHGINVVLITQGSSESSISFVVSPDATQEAKKVVEKAFEIEMQSHLIEPIKVEQDLSIIAVVGEQMRFRPGIAGRLFQALGYEGINVVAIAQGSSELNISVVIPSKSEAKALNAIHDAFFLSDTKCLNVFMVGTGLIGKTLLKQIEKQHEYLSEKLALDIRLVGLANSKTMIFDENGMDYATCQDIMTAQGEPQTFGDFVKKMKEMNLGNAVFVDNTASAEVASYYEEILNANISISTPNKIAASSKYNTYRKLKAIAESKGVQYLYETNVGAGLPILTTLKDLIVSGDRIIAIEGVLSGSLSYIFNNFVQGKSFYEILKTAQEIGLTEPDPRIDLTGTDVRRKLLILARETGWALEQEDIEIDNFLPKSCLDANGIDSFFDAVKEEEAYFQNLLKNADEEDKKLRLIAKVENGKATIKLTTVGKESAFYGLDGSDNMIVFTTERYKERPLVVRGPGAGAEVTAAGVLAELVSIGNHIKRI